MKNNRGNKKNTFTRLIKTLFEFYPCLLYTSQSPRDTKKSRMPSSA